MHPILDAFFLNKEDDEENHKFEYISDPSTKEEEEEEKQLESEKKITRQSNLEKFFGFIKQEGELNIVLCGYFFRIIASFLIKR